MFHNRVQYTVIYKPYQYHNIHFSSSTCMVTIVVMLMPAVNNIAGNNTEVSPGFKGRTCRAKWWW